MPCELFVYYRAAAHQAAAITEAVRCMQAALRVEIPQLQARLLRRPLENATGEYTWMETYALDPIGHPAGVDATCAALIEHHAASWADLRSGARHPEVFDACA
jgi:hypothetical protein